MNGAFIVATGMSALVIVILLLRTFEALARREWIGALVELLGACLLAILLISELVKK